MIHRVLPPAMLALLVLALLPKPALAEGPGLRGTIVNQTTGQPVSGQAVLLHLARADGTEAPNLETTSGPDGSFAFPDVDPTAATELAVCITYQGAMYHDAFRPPKNATSPLVRNAKVYEATDDGRDIGLASAHVILSPAPELSAIEVTEFLMFQNSGNRTFVWSQQPSSDGPTGTLHFTTPKEAFGPAVKDGLMHEDVLWHDGGFCSRGPVHPGQQNVVYSYLIPYTFEGPLRIIRPLDYVPGELVVMTTGDQGKVSGQGITPQGTAELEGQKYGVYRVRLSPGQSAVELELTGLGGEGLPALARDTRKLVAGGLVLVGVIGGLSSAVVLTRRRSAAAEMTPESDGGDGLDEDPLAEETPD